MSNNNTDFKFFNQVKQLFQLARSQDQELFMKTNDKYQDLVNRLNAAIETNDIETFFECVKEIRQIKAESEISDIKRESV